MSKTQQLKDEICTREGRGFIYGPKYNTDMDRIFLHMEFLYYMHFEFIPHKMLEERKTIQQKVSGTGYNNNNIRTYVRTYTA